MSDTFTADDSAAGEPFDSSTGFETEDFSFSDDNNLTDFDESVSDEPVSESSEPVESLFEIDGTAITLDEAKNGYLRQSDYTKKTQELAEMRQRLADAEAITEALRKDPANTLKALSDAFGVGFDSDVADPFEDMDPDERRIAVLEQKIAAQEQAATQIAIENELNAIKAEYGDFDEQSLFAHAIKGGFPNLRAAYADLNFNSLQSQLAELNAKKAEQEKRVAAKRNAASTVHNGSGRSNATAPVQNQGYGSLREAYLAAKKSLGV